jgi:ribonuclease-3
MIHVRDWIKRFRPPSSPEHIKLVRLLGFTPLKYDIYSIALRHSSAANISNGKINNQRLEYLGDAVLGMVVAEYLYRKLPTSNEGYLTQMRSKIVSRKQLNSIAEKMGLQDYIETRNHRPKSGQAILGDALEALIGAIYIDLGYKKARQFVTEKLIEKHVRFSDLEKAVISFKGRLLEWNQKEKKNIELQIQPLANEGNRPGFECLVLMDKKILSRAKGRSKKRAEESASEQACKKLGLLDS